MILFDINMKGLPKFVTPARPTDLHRTQHPLKASPRVRVLLIEDHEDSAESLKLLLELSNYEVEIARTAESGIAHAIRNNPRVVLCDIGLPDGRSGYEVAEALSQRHEMAETVLIALTGYGQDEDKHRARQAGFDHHLTKPVDPGELEKLLALHR